MVMNLNQLRVFYFVAKEESFSLAAKKLFLTQPAVTIQIHNLEDSYSIKLIELINRKVQLTDAGKMLFSCAEKIFNMVREAESVISDYTKMNHGSLNIETSRTIAKYFMPQICDLFNRQYPNIHVNLKAGNSQVAIESIINFNSDVGVVGRTSSYPECISHIPLMEDKLVIIAPFKTKYFKTEKLKISDLDQVPFIMREEGSAIKWLVNREFERENIKPNIIMELGNCDMIKEMVSKGLGISITTWEMVKAEIDVKKIRTYNFDNEFIINFDLIFHNARANAPLIKAFKDISLNYFNELNKDKMERGGSCQN